MQQFERSRVRPALRDMIVEASRALAQLDADRLEALAVSCQALNRDLKRETVERNALSSEARSVVVEMGAFASVLDATKANLQVMNRAQELCGELPQYGPGVGCGWQSREARNGHN
jgi:hypothetical protein